MSKEMAKTWVILGASILGAILLFAGIGSHALWDDEAMDALNAKAILESGDTVAHVGHNLVAYREGLLLVKGRQQGMPPLPGYLAASSMSLLGKTSFAARLPFTLCGVATIVLALCYACRLGLTWLELVIVSAALLGNVSFLLYFRNSHYYGPGIMLTTACLITYWMGLRTAASQILFGLFSALLLLSNYTWCVALYACIGMDVVLWRRDFFRMGVLPFIRVLTPPFIAGLIILWKWNPLGTKLGGYLHGSTFAERVKLFFWNWRDMNNCEFISYGIILGALFFALFRGHVILRRLLLSLIVYTLVITALSTQLLETASLADIRYMAGALPICIAITAVILVMAVRKQILLGMGLTVVACGTSLLNGGNVRFLPEEYISEVFSPTEDPYKPAASWIRENVPDGDTVWVLPDYMAYPLMFHAPNAVYAWQLRPDQKKDDQFKDFPDIHFQGLVSPDYIVAFGPVVMQLRSMLEQWKSMGANYSEIYRMNTFWKDLYRPELFWRTFHPIRDFDPETQGIYIFKKQKSDNPQK
jgi:hypothetical protein